MRILLVYPEFPDTFWRFKHVLQLIHKMAACSPLDLVNVAAFFLDLVPLPKVVPVSNTLAIMGFNFRQVVELHAG